MPSPAVIKYLERGGFFMDALRPLNIFTIQFALVFIFIFSSSVLFLMGHSMQKKSVQWISAGFSLIGMAILIQCGKTTLPVATRLILFCLFFLSGTGLSVFGLIWQNKKDSYRKLLLALVVISFVVCFLFIYLVPNIPYLMISMSLGAGFIMAVGAFNAIMTWRHFKKIHHLCLFVILLSQLGFMIYRLHIALQLVSISLNDPDPTGRLFALMLLVYAVGITLTVLYSTVEDFKNRAKKRLHKLEQLTFTDPLTGVHNKRSMMRILNAELERISRYASKCCIAIIDLDHFKNVNDTYGHLFGDQVLKGFAEITTQQLRSFDTIARYGGEEFILILPETDLYQGMLIADRLRTSLSHHKWGKEGFRQTICVGVIEVNSDNANQDIRSLINFADEALYVAKKNGRNHVEAAEMKKYA